MLGAKVRDEKTLFQRLENLKDGYDGEKQTEHQQGRFQFSGANVKQLAEFLHSESLGRARLSRDRTRPAECTIQTRRYEGLYARLPTFLMTRNQAKLALD